MPKPRRKRCSECGKLSAAKLVVRFDAADHKHYYHQTCWRVVKRWLNGFSPAGFSKGAQ